MSSLYSYLGQKSPHDNWTYSHRSSFRLIEPWEHTSNGTTHRACEAKELDSSASEAWLSASDHDSPSGSGTSRLLLEMIWVPRDPKQQVFDISENVFNQIHHKLGHNPVCHTCTSSMTDTGSLRAETQGSAQDYLVFRKKISMAWSRCKSSARTSIVCAADDRRQKVLEDLLDEEFVQRIGGLATLPALLGAIVASLDIDACLEKVKQQVQEVEVRTGHHDWQSRASKPALGDLIKLAASMSACETRISSNIPRQSTIEDIIKLVNDGCRGPGVDASCGDLSNITQTLSARVTAQRRTSEYFRARVQTQLAAVSVLPHFLSALLRRQRLGFLS